MNVCFGSYLDGGRTRCNKIVKNEIQSLEGVGDRETTSRWRET